MENRRISVFVADCGMGNRVKAGLRQLGLEFHTVVSPALPVLSDTPKFGSKRVWFVDGDGLARLPAPDIRNIVLVAGQSRIPFSALPLLANGCLVYLSPRHLDPRAIVDALGKLQRPSGRGLTVHLVSAQELTMIPHRVLEAFAHKPAGMQTTLHFASALAVSRRKFRDIVHACGFERTEHLVTILRAESWIWFARAGVPHKRFELYLGIHDRTKFRRACRRAGIGVRHARAIREDGV